MQTENLEPDSKTNSSERNDSTGPVVIVKSGKMIRQYEIYLPLMEKSFKLFWISQPTIRVFLFCIGLD